MTNILSSGRFKAGILSTVLAASLVCGNEPAGAKGVAEFKASQTGVIANLKSSGGLPYDFGFFLQNKMNFKYAGKPTFFFLADLTHPIAHGFSAMGEVQATPSTFSPRLGMNWFQAFGKDAGAYVQSTVSLLPKPDVDVAAQFTWNPAVENVLLFSKIESFTNFNFEGITFASQGVSAGVSLENYDLGLALDFAEVPGKGAVDFSVQPSIFARVNF